MKVRNKGRGFFVSHGSAEALVPIDHPIRALRNMASAVLDELSEAFEEMHPPLGRSTIAPGKMLRALLLQALYSIRSERLLIEQLGYNMLFRWFVGLSLDDETWDLPTFSRDRDAWIATGAAAQFFRRIQEQAGGNGLLSDEHFTVDAPLLQAWASKKN